MLSHYGPKHFPDQYAALVDKATLNSQKRIRPALSIWASISVWRTAKFTMYRKAYQHTSSLCSAHYQRFAHQVETWLLNLNCIKSSVRSQSAFILYSPSRKQVNDARDIAIDPEEKESKPSTSEHLFINRNKQRSMSHGKISYARDVASHNDINQWDKRARIHVHILKERGGRANSIFKHRNYSDIRQTLCASELKK